MKTSNIKQIRLLYSLFAGILLVCLGLFFSDVISAADDSQIVHLNGLNHDKYVFSITDLRADKQIYEQQHQIDSMASGLTGHAHVSGYTVDFYSPENHYSTDSRATWTMILQMVDALAILAIVVLAVIVLISFYRSTAKGKVFPTHQVSLLMVIGILILISTIAGDTAASLEKSLAYDLLQGTEWQPMKGFAIHFGQIFFGLSIIFLSQILRIGRELQEDQELTI